MRTSLIVENLSDDLVMSELARMASALCPETITQSRMTYARDLLLWITEADDEAGRSRRFTAIKQAFANWARDGLPGQDSWMTLGQAETILAFLNTEIRTEGSPA